MCEFTQFLDVAHAGIEERAFGGGGFRLFARRQADGFGIAVANTGSSFELAFDAFVPIIADNAEYGVGGYFVGVPCVLGAGGVEKIIEVEFDQAERELFDSSVSHVKELCELAQKVLDA